MAKGARMAEYSTRSVDRTLALLEYVCDRDSVDSGRTLAQCAEQASLPASTALRLLRSLESRGFVSRDDDGLFHPGTTIMRIGAGVLSHNALVRIARPEMDGLVGAVGESVYLSVRNYDGDCLYVAISECSQAIRHVSWVGKTIPSHGSAAGMVLAGQVPFEGFVVMEGTVERDVTSLSAPIKSAGQTVAAMSILVPSYRFDADRGVEYGTMLAKACARVSAMLG